MLGFDVSASATRARATTNAAINWVLDVDTCHKAWRASQWILKRELGVIYKTRHACSIVTHVNVLAWSLHRITLPLLGGPQAAVVLLLWSESMNDLSRLLIIDTAFIGLLSLSNHLDAGFGRFMLERRRLEHVCIRATHRSCRLIAFLSHEGVHYLVTRMHISEVVLELASLGIWNNIKWWPHSLGLLCSYLVNWLNVPLHCGQFLSSEKVAL